MKNHTTSRNINIFNSTKTSTTGLCRFCHQAMATTFEIFILHSNSRYAQQAAYAAFDELDRLEAELSQFIESSDISLINNLSAGQSLQIGLEVFECLQLCRRMYVETGGAFDVTIGSAAMGYRLKLDEVRYTVQQPVKAVKIDLGGIGKGYAVDKMGQLLKEWGIDTALIHGGFSSVLAIGAPPATKGWPVTLRSPGERRQILEHLYLKNRAVSASGLQQGRHIIDPRTGDRIKNKFIAWAMAPTAGTADALSTTFMVMKPEQIERYCQKHPDVSAMMVAKDGTVKRFGFWE